MVKHWRFISLIAFMALLFGIEGPMAKQSVRFGGDVLVEEGTRQETAVAIGGNVTIRGVVDGDAVAVGGSVFLASDAVVDGDAVAVGGRVVQESGAEVRGEVVEVNIPGMTRAMQKIPEGGWVGAYWAFRFLTFLGFLALALLLAAILPGSLERISNFVEQKPAQAGLWGFLALILTMPLILVLIISLVGIVLIPVVFILLGGSLVLGYIAVGRLIGKRLMTAFKKTDSSIIWETFLGVLIVGVVGWLPVLGWLVKTVVSLLGLGGAIMAVLGKRRTRQTATPIP